MKSQNIMETTNHNPIPFEATHVGTLIKDEIEDRNISQRQLSGLTGIAAPILNDILKGKRGITPEMALLFEKALDIPAHVFMNMQTNYELDCARISQRVKEQTKAMEVWKILQQYVCIPFLKKMKCIGSDVRENVKNCLRIFNVNNIDEFLDCQSQEKNHSYFKKSEKLKTDTQALFTWKYYCFYVSNKIPIANTFEKERCSDFPKQFSQIIRNNDNIIDETRKLLGNYGIRLLVVEKTDHLPVDGFSFWMGQNPTIVLTLRKKQIDNFAFTVLHEFGHIMLHLQCGNEGEINIEDGAESNLIEIEANNYASDALIPRKDWANFYKIAKTVSPKVLKSMIDELSNNLSINPSIIFGRYKFETNNYCLPNWYKTAIG